MEPEDALPHSLQPLTGACLVPDESSPDIRILFLWEIHPSSSSSSGRQHLQIFRLNLVRNSHFSHCATYPAQPLTIQFSPPSWYLPVLMSRSSPQHPALKHRQSPFSLNVTEQASCSYIKRTKLPPVPLIFRPTDLKFTLLDAQFNLHLFCCFPRRSTVRHCEERNMSSHFKRRGL
jgi:hypothetical protein